MPARVARQVRVPDGVLAGVRGVKFDAVNEIDLQTVIGQMREVFREQGRVSGSFKGGKARSVSQNSIGHAWYLQMARELREDDELGWKGYCKLHHGVPILRAEDEEFQQAYDSTVKAMTYEQKLQVMKILPVTSRMTIKQKTKYLDEVKKDFASRSVELAYPEDRAA